MEHFRVATFCRLRPPRGFEDLKTATPVQLPLNQRVVLLQQKDPKLTRAQAMKMLINKECGAGQPLQEDINNEDDEEKIFESKANSVNSVAYPEKENGFSASILSVTPGLKGSVLTVSPGIGLRNWAFQCVFGQEATQSELHGRCGLRLAVGLINGRSGALVVYGQTGSGKTHTMRLNDLSTTHLQLFSLLRCSLFTLFIQFISIYYQFIHFFIHFHVAHLHISLYFPTSPCGVLV